MRGACAEAVEFAVNRGADPNAPDAAGYLPLDVAVSPTSLRKIETTAMLVKLGVDPLKISPGTGLSVYDYGAKWLSDSSNRPLMKNALLKK